MGKLVEATYLALGGEMGSTDWMLPYLDEQFSQDTTELLTEADALLLGRVTYEFFSVAYPQMADTAPANVSMDFIERMNSIPKHVATTTPKELTWNATPIDGDVVSFVDDLKRNAGQNLLKYGNGQLDAALMEHGLIDEFHLWLAPVAIGAGQHLFESIDTAPHLRLLDVKRFDSGLLTLVYAPK